MEATSIFAVLAIGGLMGAVGQGVRVAPGLKKAHDEAADQNQPFKDTFETSRLVISLLIGAFIGILTIIPIGGYVTIDEFYRTWELVGASNDDRQKALASVGELLVGLAAAGYAGTDFVEGLIKRRLPGQTGKAPSPGSSMREPDGELPVPSAQNPAIG